MSVFNRIPAPSSAALQVAEALRRQAQAQAQQKASGGQQVGGGAGALANRAGSSFEAQPVSRKLDLSGEGTRQVAYFQPPETTQEAEEAAPLTPLEPQRTPEGISVGAVSHEAGTIYSDNVDVVLAGTTPGANYCASTAFAGIAEAVPGWASEAGIRAVLDEHGTGSSIAIWDQVSADPSFGERNPTTGQRPGLTPAQGQIREVSLPDGQPMPVELTVGDETLRFQAVEVEIRNDVDTLVPETASSTLESLDDMEVGEVRAVMMRPINFDGTSAPTEVGHWVLVEKTEDGYRLIQSAPEDWALLGGSAGTPDGGRYVQEFTGATALQDVSSYVHAEAQYSAKNAGMYAVVVLEPVVSE